MILAALFAANCLLPPGPYHPPRTETDVRFLPSDVVPAVCAQWGINSKVGCERGYGGNIRIRLALGTSEQESCRLRHALGHVQEYETAGDPNPQHIGWEYQE